MKNITGNILGALLCLGLVCAVDYIANGSVSIISNIIIIAIVMGVQETFRRIRIDVYEKEKKHKLRRIYCEGQGSR